MKVGDNDIIWPARQLRRTLLYNQRRMKSWAKTVFVAVSMLVLAFALGAEPVSQLNPTNYVNDFAHVLDQNTIQQLDNVCQQIDQKAHAQIAVVTVKSLDGSDVESYSVALFKKWGIGSKSTDHGVLILLATEDRKYRIEVGYGLEPILPDGKAGGFGREAVPLLKQNDYSGAVSLMTVRVANVIAQDAGVQLTGDQPSVPETRGQPDTGMPIGGIIVLVIIGLILLLTPFGRLLLWSMLLGGRGGGGYSGGGGFGGGGGGFGGFGGGSSGGGGASGSW
jgi:uncharacterized protein